MRETDSLSDCEIIQKKSKIAQQYEGIWSLTDEDNANLEKEIEIVSQTGEYYDDLNNQIK